MTQQRRFTEAASLRRHKIVCQGDSLTDPLGMVAQSSAWTNLLRAKLEAAGCSVSVHNIAQSGARTDDGGTTGGTGKQMLNRFTPFGLDPARPEIPDIAILWGGTNDVKTFTAMSESGTTVSGTIAAHGWSTGMLADIYGVTPAGYNVQGVTLTASDANTLQYTAAGSLGAVTVQGNVRLQTQRNLGSGLID